MIQPTKEDEIMKFRRDRFMKAQHRPPRTGPGEMGKPVILTPEEQNIADELYKKATFNVYASDKIAMDRSIPDPRIKE